MSELNSPISNPSEKQEKLTQVIDVGRWRRRWDKTREWGRAIRFMGLYYLMLISCIGILICFVWGGANLSEDLTGTIYNMDVVSGIMLGFFSVLTTFTVVFFALRAEEAATNSSNSVVQEIIDNTFNDEEKAIAMALLDTERSGNESNINENKSDITTDKRYSSYFATPQRNSIYFGVDKNIAQIFIWFLTLMVTGFLGFLAYNSWMMPHTLNAQTTMILTIGILSILITFTIVLFAFRAAQFSQISGRIASHSVIERLATSHEQIYHDLLDSFLDLLVQEKLLVGPRRYRHELFDAPDKNLNRSEQKAFDLRRNWEERMLYIFSALLATGAICSVGYFIFSMTGFGSFELSMKMITILFISLITFTTVFFSGRVILSAIGSSEIQATEMTRSELEHQKTRLKGRIYSVEKIRLALKNYLGAVPEKVELIKEEEKHRGIDGMVGDYFADLLTVVKQKTDDQIADIAEIRMHLRHLQSVGAGKSHNVGENKQFKWICDYLRKLWASKHWRLNLLLIGMKEISPLERADRIFVITRFSEARKEDEILMKLWQGQMEKKNMMPGFGEKRDEDILKIFWQTSLLDLELDENATGLFPRWEEVRNSPFKFEEQYKKEATSTNLSLEELKNNRKSARDILDIVLFLIQLELTIVRLSKAVSDLPHFGVIGKLEDSRDANWPYAKLLKELNPVFLDSGGPEPIVSNYHLSRIEEIKKAPELVEIFHKNVLLDSK